MARLRFPGRPGHRYGRSLVRYLPEKDRNRQHAFFARTAAIQRNLKWFYDLFGDSDEEDDFQGFSTSEIGELPSPLRPKKWTKKEDPSLSPKIKNVKAAWPIMGRRAGREIHYTRGDSCAEMKRGEWNTSKPYRTKQSRVAEGRIQKLKQGKNGGFGVGNREKRSVGRLSYRDMVKGLDIVRPKLIPPKPPKIKEPTAAFTKVGGKTTGKIRLPFMMPKQKAGAAKTPNPTKFKIKLLGDGKQAQIVKGRGSPRKDTAVPWGKAKLEKAQLLLKKARGKKSESSPMKFKPWGRKKLLMAEAQNGTLDKGGKVICVPKSKQVNVSKAMELVKKAKGTQRKNQEVFGSDTPGKRSVKCSSKLADMDMKGVDLQFLHRKVTPPAKKGTLSKQAGLKSKKKLKLDGKLEPKTPKPLKPSFGFIMPVVSSRSLRVIKPTKRFIEQEEFGSSLLTSPSGQDSGDWSDIPSDLDGSFLTTGSLQATENDDIKKPSKAPQSDQTELSMKRTKKKKAKHKDKKEKKHTAFQEEFLKSIKKKKSSRKRKTKVKSENETDKEYSPRSEEKKCREDKRFLAMINAQIKNGTALTESQEETLLGTTEAKWQPLRAVYKKVVKKDTLNEEESAAMRTSPLVLFQTLRNGEELMHIRGRIDGCATVGEILEKTKTGMDLTPGEKEKMDRYRRITSERQAILRSKQRAERLLKEGEAGEGAPVDPNSMSPRAEGSPKVNATSSSPRAKKKPELTEEEKAKQLEQERERLMKKFLEEKENFVKTVTEHREAAPAEGLPSMRALYRKAKQGLELTSDEIERMKKGKILTNRRCRLRNLRKMLQKVYKGSGKENEVAMLDVQEPDGLEPDGQEPDDQEPKGLALSGDSLGLSPNSRRLLALGSELYERNSKIKKKKKKKKNILDNTLSVGLGSIMPMSKVERLKWKKKKKKKKAKEGMTKEEIKLRKKNASSKLLLKAKQRKQKGKGMKLKKSAARKLKLGAVLEDEMDSLSRMKSLLHDKLLSPADKTLQDTVSRQMADALEADMSPDQTEASNANVHQVANEVTVGSVAVSGGPRIKHVCRRQSVALGYSPARYEGQGPTSHDSLKLSALPFKERKKLFTSDDDNSDTETGSEGDLYDNETSPRLSTRKRKPTAKKRAMEGFLTMDEEANYLEKNYSDFASKKEAKKVLKLKKALQQRSEMASMSTPWSSMPMPKGDEELNVKRRSRCGQCSACLRKYDCKKCANCLDKPKYGGRGTKKQACIHRKCHNLVKMKMWRLKQMKAKKLMAVPEQAQKAPSVPRPAGARIKRAGGDVLDELGLVPSNTKGQAGDKGEKTDASSKSLRTVKFSKKIRGKHFIKTDFKDDYDMSVAWKRGMVIISSDPMIPRTICYLCGSNGKHELVYCNVCCEPFHDFCLEDDERPLPGEKENWCCRNCRFCHVCDHQDKLLTCHKCHCSYHAECLGPNYPTKPSKKRKIWVCSRCVRCKSCGATTPGSDPKAQWMHGFSHCQECGKLFEKGNYCPVCKKCYEDDDFESKMVQCADCNRWVHAKCENLSDDQYRILTELPDSVPYRCPPCAKHKPTPWKGEVDEELQAGFMNVLNALYSCKNAGHLIWPNRRFKYMRKVHQGDSSRSSNGPESRESSSSPALSEASSLERETPTPDRGLEAGGDGGTSSAQDDVEETYSFRRGRTVRRVLRRRRQQRNAGNADGAGKGDEDGGMRSKDSGREDVDVEEVGRTLRDGDGSRSDNAESDVVMVDGDDDARSSGPIHPVFDRDAERTDGDVQKTSSTEPLVADADKIESIVADDDRVIAVDDEEDDALRTKKEEQKPEDGPISFSTTAKVDVASSVESIPTDTSQENISSESHVPKDDNNAERTSHRVSISSEDIAMTSADDLEPPVVESSPAPVVEDQKHESQMVVESKDRTEVVSSEPKCTDNSSLADFHSVDHQDGSGESLGDSKMDTSNLASDGETSAAEEVDIDIESTDVKAKRTEVDDVDDSGGGSSFEERTSRDTNTPLPEDASGSLVDTAKGAFDDASGSLVNTAKVAPDDASGSLVNTAKGAPDDVVSPKLEKEEAETVFESETKVSIVSPEAVPDVDPNIPDAVLEVTTSTQPEQDASKTPAKVVTIEIGKKEEEEKKEEEIKPTSFQFVKAKMMAGYYKSVEKFTKDCVTIFQASFNQETSLIPGLSKSNVIAKGAFFKIMIQMFPWFNIEETRLWNGEERFEENGVLQVAVEPPHKDHEYAQWRYRALMPAITAQPSPFKKLPTPRRRHSIIGGNRCSEDDSHLTALDDVSDPRRCCLCGVMGDDDPNNAGRLLYCGQDEWIHINCALWSAEVFEEVDGSLINVHAAISRGRMMRCEVCNNLGATVGCCSRGCPANFHFMCARSRNAMFQEDKKVYCFQHTDKVDKAIMGSDLFGVLRRVCVSLDNMKPNRTFSQGLEAKNINVMIGSWSLESLGHLGFLSDTEKGIFPLDFACSRVYWSTVDPCRRCIYTMRIIEVNPLTSPTLPQEINHTTEHSPGSYPFSRKPTVQDDDDTDILTDALMEATKESNEAAMALDQVAALLAGSQTVSEIQNAADILAATSSLFEMDDGVLDSLNLDANLNPCLDGDGIMDMMADLDNLDGLNSDGALGDFSENGEKFLQSDKPVSLPAADPTHLDMDNIVSAVSKEVQEETSTPQTDSAVTLLMDDSVKEREEKPDSPAGMMETEEKHAKVAVNDEAEIETDIAECTSNIRPDSPLISPKKGPYVKLVDIKDKQLASVATSDSAEASEMADASDTSMPLDDDPEVTQPDSPLISPKKVPMLKLVKLALDQHEKSYPESEDESSDATSETHRNTTPRSGCRQSLDNPQTSCMLSTNVSPLPNQPGMESATSQPLTLPSVSISPSEKESSPREPSKDERSEVTATCEADDDSELSARSREEKGTDLASCDFKELSVTKDLPAEIKEAETVGADGPIEQIEQNSSTEQVRIETDSPPSIVPESPNEKPCKVTPSKTSVSAIAETREVTPANEQITAEPEIQNESVELIEGKSSDTAFPGSLEEQEHVGMEIALQGQIKSDEEVGNVVTCFEMDKATSPGGKTREEDTLVISDCSAATTLAEPEEPRDGGIGCLDVAEDQADGHGLQVDFPSESHDAVVRTEETSMMKIHTGDAAQSVSMASYQYTMATESSEDSNVQQFKPKFPLHKSQCPPIDEQDQVQVQSPITGEHDHSSNEEANVGKVSEEEQQRCLVIHSVDDSPTSSPGELDTDIMTVTSDSLSSALSIRAENLTHSPKESTAVQDLPTQSPVDLDIDVIAVSTDSLSSTTDVTKQFESLGSQDASQSSSPDIPVSDQEENTTKESLTDSTSNIVTVVLDEESLSNPDDFCHEIQDVSSDDDVETVQLLGKRDPNVARLEGSDFGSSQSSPHTLQEDILVGLPGQFSPVPETSAILDTKDDKSALPLDVPADTPQDSPEDMEKEPKIDKSDVTIVSTVENYSKIIEISEPCSETASVGSPKSCLTSTVNEENEAPVEQNNEVMGKGPSIKEITTGPIATGCAAERSFDGDISTAAPDHVEHGARYLEDSTPDKTGGPQDASDWPVTPVDAQLESSAPFPETKETNIVNEEQSVLEKQEQTRNYGVEDKVEAKEVSPEFERLTEELRVQGVGEEDIMSIVVSQTHQSPEEVPDDAKPVMFVEDAPPRRLSSDPEHESIFKALATSLSSSVARKNNNNRESLRRQEREPILSAFASDLNSRHHKHTQEDEEEPENVKKIVSPTTSKNIFKKLDNPKFANAFKAFMETKQEAKNVVDELINEDLVREVKNTEDMKRRKSSRLSSADSSCADKFHSVLQNGDDSHIASSFKNSDQTKRKTRHSSSDVLESDDSSSKLDVLDVGHRGRKKYPMRTTSSRLLRIADSGDPDNQVFSPEEDVERSDACHDEQTQEGQEDDKTSLTRKSSDTSHDGRRRLSSEDSLKSPRSFSRKKSHHASQHDEFDGDQEEKENEAVKGRRGRPRKSLDIIWSPEKECGTLNHIEAEELEGRPMRTRGLSRKSSSRMKEIIAAELEDEDDGETEEIVQKKGRGRGRPRKYPVADQIQVGHISAREGEKPRGRGRPRKYPSLNEEQSLSRDQIEARKRGRDSACADFEVLEKGKQEEEGMPKRKRGRPRLSDKQPEKDQFVDSENENAGDDSKKRMRGELTSTSDEEHHGPEQDQPRLRTRSSAKRLKPGEEPVEDGEETSDSKPNVSSRSEERQVHPRKQSVVARSFPGEDAQSGTQSPSKKGPLADSRDSSKQTNMLPNNEVVMHGEAAITPKLNQMKQVQETPDTSSETPMAESSSSEKQVRVTVKIDPVTGAISEAFTYTDDESMEVDMGLNDDPPPPQALSVEANPTRPALPSQTPWNIVGKSTQGASDLNSSNQLKGRNIYHVQSNIGSKKVIIGKDVTTNQVIYSNGPTSVRNPTGGLRIRGPSMIRYPGLLPNNTRQARTRGPFSRNSSVVWQGNTAALKPGVNAKILKTPVATQQAIASIQGTIPQKMQVGVASVAGQSIALTGQSISNLLPNTVPGILSSQGMSSAMNLPQGFQPLPQAALVATSIVTTVGSPDVLSMVTTTANTNTLTSSAQEQYLSILQRSYQVSQIQQVNALAGIMPQTFPQPGLLQNFGVPQIGVASPEVAPFINQTYPTLMASSTLQTLQTLIQQAGVQSSMGQMTPGVQPLTPSPTPVNPVNPLLPTTPMDTSLSGFISSLSPPFQQQPGIVPLTSYTDAMSPFHREHMYARQKSGGSNKRRKSPHQVKVWFDSYGSLKNEDDENQEETSNKVPSPPSVKTPAVRMKNPSNVPRARVKNPTFGMEETRSNKSLIKVSKKKAKGSDGSSGWNSNASFDPFAGLSTDDAFFAAMPNLGQSDHHDDSPSLLLTLMEQEKKRGPSTTPRRPSNRPHLMFEIRSDDGFETRAETVEEAWGRVIERAGELRTNTRRKHLSFDGVKGLKMLGINHEAIIFLMEQLYGAGNCQKYKFKFHKHEETAEDDEPPVNPHGCARAEISKRTSTFDIFNFLASHHRNRPIFNEFEQQDETSDIQHKSSRRATSLQDLPMAMRFRHLKQTAKEAVGVYRSGIHGRGLFCRRLIEAGEMVIEYSGIVIRSILTDKREKYYESKGIGCYMFRIDDFDVVDATTSGNAARFINHSCDSNCFSRVIEVGGQKHIIIFASRRIAKGEELTYDYKFPIEDVKIPCNCGSRKCRKYLN